MPPPSLIALHPEPARGNAFILFHLQASVALTSWLCLLALGLTASAQGESPRGEVSPSAPASTQTEILWDTWGVPHIYGQDLPGMFHAFGWAQMQSHGNLILRLYGQARGRAAEYWGKEFLEADRWVRTMGVPRRAEDWLRQLTPATRGYLEAFIGGMNAYAREHPDELAVDLQRVLPLHAADVLAHGQRVVLFHFVTSPEAARSQARRWGEAGSNAWAIAPRRSSSGRAMLLANPHLPWRDFYLWYEAQLTAPGLDVYGAALVGSPFPGIAFNEFLGWTHTVNTHDGADLYELTLAEGGYRWDGAVRAFEQERQMVSVRQPDGTAREEPLLVRRSVHGPVIAEKAGRALALRVVGLSQSRSLEQYLAMARAKNLREFERALQQMQLPMFTVIYADRDGHILHLFGGETPVRPRGNFNWGGIVPGDTHATLWTKTHPYRELPRVIDPPSGWLQNANDPPWTTTFPQVLDPARFPAYLAPRGMSFRAQRSARLLDGHDRISFEEMIHDKFSTRVEMADRLLDDLAAAVERQGGAKARRAMEVLSAWDRCAEPNSRGAVLFERFFAELTQRSSASVFALPWSEQAPRATPDGLADPSAAAAALEAAATQVEAAYGQLDVPWGDVHRFRAGDMDLPANGAPGDPLGVFRSIGYRKEADGKFAAMGGDSYVAAVEFSHPVRARTVLSYGNASQPGSPHAWDQLPLVARKEMRTVWRSRAEIETHLEGRKAFTP